MTISYTVTQINNNIDNILQSKFGKILIEGEISSLNISPNGHAYFTLKDDNSELTCVMFQQNYNQCNENISIGSKVKADGFLSIYKPKGNFQFKVNAVNKSGKGKFWENFQELKKKLSNEGLFDDIHKQTIPKYLKNIAIITSLNGVVKDDIINLAKQRCTYQSISIFPVTVQGSNASLDIINSINYINKTNKFDIIIIARGGGSIEDLWAFNDESLARTIFNSSIPVISAIGHETDFTISDFVADCRASTPSHAAKLISLNQAEILQHVDDINIRLNKIIQKQTQDYKDIIDILVQSKVLINPMEPVYIIKNKILDIVKYLNLLIHLKIERSKDDLEFIKSNLMNLSPMNVINRGYSLLLTKNNKSISLTKEVEVGDSISSLLSDGILRLEVAGKDVKEKNK